eukprot:329354_1
MQDKDHIREVSRLANAYITPGGPDGVEPKYETENDNKDDKKEGPPSLLRQITEFYFNKYSPTELKEKVEKVFQTYFDIANNGDIDIKEFKIALQNLGLNMTPQRIEKLFTLISSNDGDLTEQYVDKVNFSDFILQKYTAPQLQSYQENLLKILSPKFDGNNNNGTGDMISSQSTDESEEIAMKRHLGLMVEQEMKSIEADAIFQEEIMKRKTNRNRNKRFCD